MVIVYRMQTILLLLLKADHWSFFSFVAYMNIVFNEPIIKYNFAEKEKCTIINVIETREEQDATLLVVLQTKILELTPFSDSLSETLLFERTLVETQQHGLFTEAVYIRSERTLVVLTELGFVYVFAYFPRNSFRVKKLLHSETKVTSLCACSHTVVLTKEDGTLLVVDREGNVCSKTNIKRTVGESKVVKIDTIESLRLLILLLADKRLFFVEDSFGLFDKGSDGVDEIFDEQPKEATEPKTVVLEGVENFFSFEEHHSIYLTTNNLESGFYNVTDLFSNFKTETLNKIRKQKIISKDKIIGVAKIYQEIFLTTDENKRLGLYFTKRNRFESVDVCFENHTQVVSLNKTLFLFGLHSVFQLSFEVISLPEKQFLEFQVGLHQTNWEELDSLVFERNLARTRAVKSIRTGTPFLKCGYCEPTETNEREDEEIISFGDTSISLYKYNIEKGLILSERLSLPFSFRESETVFSVEKVLSLRGVLLAMANKKLFLYNKTTEHWSVVSFEADPNFPKQFEVDRVEKLAVKEDCGEKEILLVENKKANAVFLTELEVDLTTSKLFKEKVVFLRKVDGATSKKLSFREENKVFDYVLSFAERAFLLQKLVFCKERLEIVQLVKVTHNFNNEKVVKVAHFYTFLECKPVLLVLTKTNKVFSKRMYNEKNDFVLAFENVIDFFVLKFGTEQFLLQLVTDKGRTEIFLLEDKNWKSTAVNLDFAAIRTTNDCEVCFVTTVDSEARFLETRFTKRNSFVRFVENFLFVLDKETFFCFFDVLRTFSADWQRQTVFVLERLCFKKRDKKDFVFIKNYFAGLWRTVLVNVLRNSEPEHIADLLSLFGTSLADLRKNFLSNRDTKNVTNLLVVSEKQSSVPTVLGLAAEVSELLLGTTKKLRYLRGCPECCATATDFFAYFWKLKIKLLELKKAEFVLSSSQPGESDLQQLFPEASSNEETLKQNEDEKEKVQVVEF